MNAEALDLPECAPIISSEGRFFRVSVLRRGRVESYLCETEAEAKRWAELLSQPPSEAQRGPRISPPKPAGETLAGRALKLVRMGPVPWKRRP